MRDKGAMIPMKHSSVFKNRWFACLWAAGIIWFAYDVASGAPQAAADSGNNEAQAEASPVTDATGSEVSKEQQEQLKKALDSIG